MPTVNGVYHTRRVGMQKFYRLNWKIIGTISVAALVVVTLFSAAGRAPVRAQADLPIGPSNSISVSGSGQASGTPDVAYINLGIDTTDADVGQAVENANTEIAAIIAALTDAGVDAKDIQTTNFNVYPEDRYD